MGVTVYMVRETDRGARSAFVGVPVCARDRGLSVLKGLCQRAERLLRDIVVCH